MFSELIFPNPGFCRFVAGNNAGDAADQLKTLIRELHRAGLEVLLEVGIGLMVDLRPEVLAYA